MADFTVINTNDSGSGSLRAALLGAALLGGTPTIDVHSGTGKLEVLCQSPLPIMTQPFRLDCLTQEGSNDDRPMLHLNFAPMAAPGLGVDPVFGLGGLQLSGGGQVIKGLGVKNAPVSGILANGASDTTFVCISTGLGLDGNALADALTPGTLQPGLAIVNSKNTKIGGRLPRTDCVFSGSGTCHPDPDPTHVNQYVILPGDIQQSGLACSNSDGVTIFRSRFGMNWAGTAAVRNTFDGASLDKTKHILIGGRDPAVRCSFGGNLFYGLNISHFLSNGARVIGCEAGFGSDGQTPIPNQRSNYIFFNCGEWVIAYCLSGWCIRNGLNADGSTPGNPALPTLDDTSKGWTREGWIYKFVAGLCRDGVTPAPNTLSDILLTQCQDILIDQCGLYYGLQDGILIEGRTTPDYQSYDPVVPRWNVVRGTTIMYHGRHGVFINAGKFSQIGDGLLPDGLCNISNNVGTSVTARKYWFDTNKIDPGNTYSGNGTDKPLVQF